MKKEGYKKIKIIVKYPALIIVITLAVLVMGVNQTSGFSKVSRFLIITIPPSPSDIAEESKMCGLFNVSECRLNPDRVNEIPYSDEDKSATSAVTDLITALPVVENLILDDVTQVEAVRLAYDSLTESQKVLVLNYAMLIAAENQIQILKDAYASLQADTSAAQVVTDLITALPAVENLVLDNATQVETARSAYDNLTESQKALVLNYAVLTIAENQIQILIDGTDIII